MPGMDTDHKQIGQLMQSMVPWVKTAGIEFLEASPTRITVELPDEEQYRNHVGGPHAAMMFGAAETASGALMITAFAEQLGSATPLVVRGEIKYSKLALGTLRATAELGRDAAEVIAELATGARPEIPIQVTISNADGQQTGQLDVLWTLKPHR